MFGRWVIFKAYILLFFYILRVRKFHADCIKIAMMRNQIYESFLVYAFAIFALHVTIRN